MVPAVPVEESRIFSRQMQRAYLHNDQAAMVVQGRMMMMKVIKMMIMIVHISANIGAVFTL